MQAKSKRGDTTPCQVTSTLAGVGAVAVSIAAVVATVPLATEATSDMSAAAFGFLMADCSGGANPQAGAHLGDTMMRGTIKAHVALWVKAGLLGLSAAQWTSFYLNSKASKEKTAFDDAHQSLIRSLDAALCKHQTTDVQEK